MGRRIAALQVVALLALVGGSGPARAQGPPTDVDLTSSYPTVQWPGEAELTIGTYARSPETFRAVPAAVELQADAYPFEGTFASVRRVETGARGRATLRQAVDRATRFRAVAADAPSVVSEVVEVSVELDVNFDWSQGRDLVLCLRRPCPKGPLRGEQRLEVRHPSSLRLARRAFRFYLARDGDRRFTRVASARGRRVSATRTLVEARYRLSGRFEGGTTAQWCVTGVSLRPWGIATCPGKPPR
jgi:hypothetical protein